MSHPSNNGVLSRLHGNTGNYSSVPTFSQTIPPPDSDDDDDAEPSDNYDTLSTISVRITVPLNITGDQNTVSIDPAANGSAIATSVVHAVRELTMLKDGVPVIDENGKPRPIKIEVEAEVNINGTGNVVGQKAVEVSKVGPENELVASARGYQKSHTQQQAQTRGPGFMDLNTAGMGIGGMGPEARRIMLENRRKKAMQAMENTEAEETKRGESSQESNKRPRTE